MISDRIKRLARFAVASSALLLIQGLFATHAAWAGCNHQVRSRMDSSFEFDRIDELIVARPELVSSDDATRNPDWPGAPNRQAPCSGMNCSSQTPSPSSTALPEYRNIDQWGNLGMRTIVDGACPNTRWIEESISILSGYKPAIFHPPPN
jgi:hypothetical protein